MMPIHEIVSVEILRAVKENPEGRQKRSPHKAWLIKVIPIQPEGWKSPCSRKYFTICPNAQSSFSGKFPIGLTMIIARHHNAVRASKSLTPPALRKDDSGFFIDPVRCDSGRGCWQCIARSPQTSDWFERRRQRTYRRRLNCPDLRDGAAG